MTKFNRGLEKVEEHGKQSSKEQAMRICIAEASEIIDRLFGVLMPLLDSTQKSKVAFKIEAWKEQRDNL